MLRLLLRPLIGVGAFVVLQSTTYATLISPQVGWQATLSTLGHNVSGTVTIVDEDTLRFDDFTYDGGASSVYFYLGAFDDDSQFKIPSGLKIEPILSGTSYDGTQPSFTRNLPAGETLEGYHAISVWCDLRDANFGSGTFAPLVVPEPTAIALLAFGAMGLFSYRRR